MGDIEPRRRADLTTTDVDTDALISALLDHYTATNSTIITGPEWATQVRPPAIPGTIQDRYVKATLWLRLIGFAIVWVTWDWKRGGFVALVTVLILVVVHTR